MRKNVSLLLLVLRKKQKQLCKSTLSASYSKIPNELYSYSTDVGHVLKTEIYYRKLKRAEMEKLQVSN